MALFKKDSKKKETTGSETNETSHDLSWVLVQPKVTEKSAMISSNNQFTFVVAEAANKIQIKKAVALKYKVTPISVNIVRNAPRKETRRGRKVHKKGSKKAIVTLKKGQTIEFA